MASERDTGSEYADPAVPQSWGTPTSLPPTWGSPGSLPPTYSTPQTYPDADGWGSSVPPQAAAPAAEPTPDAADPARRPWPRRLIVAVAVGAVVLGVVVALLVRANRPADPAALGVAQRFYAALERNDAQAALAETVTPSGETTLLTDGVLRTAHEAAPLANVSVRMDGDVAVVTYAVGGQQRTDRLRTTTTSDGPKLDDPFATVASSMVSSPTQPLTIAGVRPQQATTLLFPGRYPVSSGNANLTYADGWIDAVPGGTLGQKELPLAATDAGVKAFRAATKRSLDACVTAKSLAPAGCPFSYQPGPDEQIDANSIAWSLDGDPTTDLTPTLGSDPTAASARVTVTARLTATSKGAAVTHRVTATAQAVSDLTTQAPTVTWH